MSNYPPAPSTGLTGGSSPRNALIVGVADFKCSKDPNVEIVTYALGSCLGVTFHDPVRRIGSMLHAMLPSAKSHQNAEQRIPMFVDTGVKFALEEMRKLGAREGDIRCKVFGGAQVMEADSFFKIGANNSHAFCQLSRELSLTVLAWEISGRENRTIRLYNATGDVAVKLPSRPEFIR